VEDQDWLYREIGRRIRDARRRASLTQVDLAQKAGLARTSITNIEMGNQQPTIHALWRIADSVQTSPCDLLPKWPRQPAGADSFLPNDVPAATRAALLRIDARQTKRRS
jgi:transcriptional regulator with XRE-family HTH domain